MSQACTLLIKEATRGMHPFGVVAVCFVAFLSLVAAESGNGTQFGCSAFPGPLSTSSVDFKYHDSAFDSCTPRLPECTAAQCACLGLQYEGIGKGCVGTSTSSCANASRCVRAYIECVNAAALESNTTTTAAAPAAQEPCERWSSSIRLADLEVTFDVVLYNESWLFSACRSSACALLHRYVAVDALQSCPRDQSSTTTPRTALSNNESTPLPYSEICVSPVVFYGTLVLNGNFTVLFTTRYGELVAALAQDLTNVLLIQTTIVRLALGSLIIDFSLPVSASNPLLIARLAVAAADDTWLLSTKAAYVAAGGDLSTFGIRSIGATPTPAPGSTNVPDVATAAPNATTPAGNFTLPPESGVEDPACGGGCIAGIVLAILVVIIIAGVIGFCCYKRSKRLKKLRDDSNEPQYGEFASVNEPIDENDYDGEDFEMESASAGRV